MASTRPTLQRQNAIRLEEEELSFLSTAPPPTEAAPKRSPTDSPTRPRIALLNIDLQNDFIDGSMEVDEAESILPKINQLAALPRFDMVIYSLDHHPPDHISFLENVQHSCRGELIAVGDEILLSSGRYGLIRQQVWPRHCVRGSEGARLSSKVELPLTAVMVYKGTESEVEAYSAFGNASMRYDTRLHRLLQTAGVTDLYVTGLAEDICVAHSVLDALNLNYRVTVVQDAVRGVDEDRCRSMKDLIKRRGGRYMSSEAVVRELRINYAS